MTSEIHWHTGTPTIAGTYIITCKSSFGYTVRRDYYHSTGGWMIYDDERIVAWSEIEDIEPYKPIE